MAESQVEQSTTEPGRARLGGRQWRLRAGAVLLSAGLAAAFVPGLLPGNAHAAPAFTTTIVNQANGNCVDVPGGANTSALQLIQWTCNSGTNQNFSFTLVSGSTYTVGTGGTGLCLDINGASSADNATVIQYACHSATNQQFRLQPVTVSGATNTFNVVSVGSGKCVVPAGDASASNTALVQLPCTSAASRVWRLPSYTGGGSPAPSPTRTPGPSTPPPPTSDWNPPANLVSPLAAVWKHQEDTYNNGNLYGFRNYGWDQLMANKGYVNYCVRWDSSANVTTAQRDAIHAALRRQVKKWMDTMIGHNAFPYREVPVNIVGWAVRNRNQLQWSDTSVDIYVNNIRENAPQCSEECGRFFNQSGNYSRCPGGVARHYDQSLWLTDGFGGGAGGDWGQRMGREYFMGSINSENMTILLHELGHTYGLDDFYDWSPISGGFLMKAGSASTITEFDKWMFRDWWRHLKSRYGY